MRIGKYCSNCGRELQEDSDVCLSCGKLVREVSPTYYTPQSQSNQGKALSTISVVFGALGFWPLIIIGSIVGLVTSIIGLSDDANRFKERSKIGLGLSIGSLAFWLILMVIGRLSYFF